MWLALMQWLTLSAYGDTLTLGWDPSPDPSVVGYKVYYGSGSRNYTNSITLGNSTSTTISGLVEGVTYYFAVTAYNSSGLESDFSNEISYTVPNISVNQPPTLNTINNLPINEDAGQQTVNLSGISSGSVSENQTLTVTASSSNTGLVPNPTVNYSSPNSTGTLTFTPVANANGTATITVTVNDGQAQSNTVTRTFVVTVSAVNDTPVLNTIGNLSINEDASQQTVNLAGVSSGAANENQTLTVTASSSNTGLIPNPTITYTTPNTTGTLRFTPVADANGSATITVTVSDGVAQFNRTFTVTVNAVNDTPTLSALSNLSLNESAGLQTVNLSGISSGAANENQTLTVTASSSNTGLVPNPTVNYTSPNSTGSLTFTPVANASGTATLTVTVNDGLAQFSRTFTVTVNSVNNAPTLDTIVDLTINEDVGQQTVNLSGIGSGAVNETQTLTVTASSSNTGLVPNPTITYTSPNSTGTLRFTPVADANGSATITVTVNDGQAQNNTIARTFVVTVNAVNDTPTLNAIGNLTVNENAAQQTVNLSGIGSGAANENQTLSVTASSSNTGLIPNPTVTYSSPNSTGTLRFTPVANTDGSATITVTVNDGQAQFSRTFTVTVNSSPTISAITDRTIYANTNTGPISFTVGDSETPSGSLTLAALSSNPALIPVSNIAFGGSAANRTVTLTPLAGQIGTSTITITVNDGSTTASTAFQLIVQNGPPAPPTNLIIIATNGVGSISPNLNAQTLTQGKTYTVTAVSGEGQMFSGWTGSTNTTSPTISFAMNNSVSLQANFVPLNLSTNGNGTITPNLMKTANMVVGRTYTITAVGGPGQVFMGWTGSTNTESPQISFVMNTNIVLRANFVPLNLNTNGNGTMSPNLKTTANLISGRSYTIEAIGGSGQIFAGWTGTTNTKSSKISFVMKTNVLLTANFVPFYLTIVGDGKVSPDLRTTRNLILGKTYTMTAKPNAGQVFAGWSGSTNTLSPAIRFVMATNLAFQAAFIPSPYIPMAGSYNGLFYENDEVRQESAGFLNVVVSTRGTYSGRLQIGSARYSFSGMLDLDCQAANVINRKGTNALNLALSFGSGDEIDRVTGQLTDGNWVATVSGDRAIFNSRTNPAPFAGDYTMIVPGQADDATLPAGDGYGSLRVDGNGKVQVSGALADGSKVTQSTMLSKGGNWPFYVPLYSSKGSVLSWLTFTNRPQDDINGLMSWIKQGGARGSYYTNGFTNIYEVAGSKYIRPLTTNLLINLPEAMISFEGGNLALDFTNQIALGPSSRVTNLSTNKLSMSFSSSKGTFSGSVTDPSSGKSLKFQGAVLQKLNEGFGFLLSTNQSSRVVISP